MGLISNFAEWWEDFKTEFKTETEKQIDRQDIKKINRALDEDRGYAKGEAKQEKRKRKEMEERVAETEEKNVSQHLHQQREKLKNQSFEGATSMRRLFEIADNHGIELMSSHMKRNMGEFHDFWITESSQIAVVNKEGNPVSVGKDFSDILYNAGGLNNEVQKQVISLSVNSDGKPIESPNSVKVPDIQMGPDGNWVVTESHQEDYLNKVGEYRSKVNSLMQKNKALEKSVVGLSEKINELERDLETSNSISESLREQLDTRLEEMKSSVEQFDAMQRQTSRMTSNKQMSEEIVMDFVNNREQLVNQITKQLDEDELDVTEDKIRRIVDLAGQIDNRINKESGEDVAQALEGELEEE